VDLIERKCCLTGVDLDLSLLRLEDPGDVIFRVGHKADCKLTENVDVLVVFPIVFVRRAQVVAERLTYYIIEWHSEEVAPEQKQQHAPYAIELAPLGLLLKNLVYLDCLSSFFDCKWQLFFVLFGLKFLVKVLDRLELNPVDSFDWLDIYLLYTLQVCALIWQEVLRFFFDCL
jgi:hypothetical protein